MHSTDQAAQRLGTIAAEVFASELEEARRAGAIGYMTRGMAQATMPHSNPNSSSFERSNGLLTLSIFAPASVGIPYGSIPRLLLAWVTTEAVRRRDRHLVLGDTLSGFMRQLDLAPTGGRWGTIPRLRDQMRRLFSSAISVRYADPRFEALRTTAVADEAVLWWDPKQPDQAALWQSTVTLSEPFYRAAVERPIPIDMSALKALKRSPLALDLYVWLTYRNSYLRKPTTVPWEALHGQLGADYRNLRDFRPEVRRALCSVTAVYPRARVDCTPAGLRLAPAPTHVRVRS